MSAGQASRWKVLAAGMAVVAGLCLAAGARGAEIRNVTAKQRYPWNGLVDIRFTAAGVEEGIWWPLEVAAVEPDSGEVRELSHFWLVRDGTNTADRAVHADGEYGLLWDARADLGEVVCSNMVVQVAFGGRPMVRLWEDGPYWADRNIGAEEPWDYGWYFWWGDILGYKWVDGQWTASDGSVTGYMFASTNTPTQQVSNSKLLSRGWITTNGVLAPECDAAQVQWGGGWRMPTTQELTNLLDNCEWTWTTTNGIKGYAVRGRGDFASSCIFLPAAGWGNKAARERDGSYAHFWASDPNESLPASWSLNFRSTRAFMEWYYDRFVGKSIRPVQGAAE